MASQSPHASRLETLFVQRFGKPVDLRIVQAPGRVNLIGEHTDYNDGFVIPAAIDFHTFVAVGRRTDSSLVVHSVHLDETRIFDLVQGAYSTHHHWSDYVWGVALELRRAGILSRGANLLINGNVPLASGLSSSASLEMAIAYVLGSLSGSSLDLTQLALLCQRAENDFVGARCGIMDQFISAHGRRDHALVLDCRSLEYELLPLPRGVSLVICNSMVKHELASGEYNARRRECEQGLALLSRKLAGMRALRDVTLEQLQEHASLLPGTIYSRCRHVVSENHRTLAAAQALKQEDLATMGRLMRSSYESLRDDYEVSCAELDVLVEIASRAPGVLGARMTGGGFGGCTVNLVEDAAVNALRQEVAGEYAMRFGIRPEIYATKASGGVSDLTAADSDFDLSSPEVA